MKLSLSLFTFLVFSFHLQAQNINDLEFGSAGTFDVVTWNIQDFPRSGQSTINYVSQIVQELNADVIALQEIDNRTSFQQLLDDLEGWDGYYTNYSFLNLAYIYKTSAVEILDVFEIYTNDNREFPRAPLVMELRYRGEFFVIINNHLKCCGDGFIDQLDPWDEETRRFGASYLLNQYIETNYPNDKVIVLGDFNDVLTDNSNHNVFQPFLSQPEAYRFADTEIATGTSFNWSYPDWPSHIDHLLVTNELFNALDDDNAVVQTIKIDNYLPGGLNTYYNEVSDHRPVGFKLNSNLVNVDYVVPETWNFSISPNPVRGWSTLSFDAITTNGQLAIYNVNGQLVQEYALSSRQTEVTWNASAVPAGLYYVRLQKGDEVAVRKVVVQ